MAKSKVFELDGALFRYDYESGVVEYIIKASKEEVEEDRKWKEKYGHSLLDIDKEAYMVVCTAGLSVGFWKDKEAREEYLSGWLAELRAETEQLANDFLECEMSWWSGKTEDVE